jgi:hypothetical protein
MRACSQSSCFGCPGLPGDEHARIVGPDLEALRGLGEDGALSSGPAGKNRGKQQRRNAPSATVVPMALSTGARASDSSPKPTTVDALHSASDTRVRCGSVRPNVSRSEEQRVVRTDADHEEQGHEVENVELASA